MPIFLPRLLRFRLTGMNNIRQGLLMTLLLSWSMLRPARSQTSVGGSCGNRNGVYTRGYVDCNIQATAPRLESAWGGRAGGRQGATGSSDFAAPETKPSLKWMNSLSSNNMFKYNSPIFGGDGSIYFVTANGQVFAYGPSGLLLWVVTLDIEVEGVAAVWGNVLFVASKTGLHAIDTRVGDFNIQPALRKFASWPASPMLGGGMTSSPVVDPYDKDHGPVVYVTAHDQYVYKLAVQGSCNSLVSEPCSAMTFTMVWRKKIDFTDASKALYTLQDDRCTAPYKLGRDARIHCVMCKRQLPCDATCSYCEDQTVGGYNPLRSSPVLYGDMLYVVAWDGLHALKQSDGERVWHHYIMLSSSVDRTERFAVGTSFHRQRLMALSCVALPEAVIFPSGPSVLCLQRKDGSVKWRRQHPKGYDYTSTPVVYRFPGSTKEADAVLISSMDGNIYCLDIDSGDILWTYSTGLENTTQALAPVVDSYSNLYFLAHNLTALSHDGRSLWIADGCGGYGIMSSVAISREGMLATVCNDSSLRLYCCRTCEANEPVPAAGSAFNAMQMAVNVTIKHRMLWQILGSKQPMGMCRMGAMTWPVKQINETLVQCQIPTLKATIDGIANPSLSLPQHTVLYRKCYFNLTTDSLVEVPCSYVDETDSFLPVCRERVQDAAIGFSKVGMTTSFCKGCIACTKLSRLDIDLDIEWVGKETCTGQVFTYFLPIIVVKNETIFPAKLPKDYTPLIINIVIVGCVALTAVVIYMFVRYKLEKYMEELEEHKVQEMAAFLNSPDLDPSIKRIIINARNRLQNSGSFFIEAWEKWRDIVYEAQNTALFLKVGKVKTQAEYDILLSDNPEIQESDRLWLFVLSQNSKGDNTWLQTRRVLDILTGFSPSWGDLWACYLEVEIEDFRKKLRQVRRLRSYARRGRTVWERNHEHFESLRHQSWVTYHTHSLTTDRGFSSICRALTKFDLLPTTSVGLGAAVVQNEENHTFVYFGDDASGSIGVGVAHESIPLQIKPHETGREQKAWYYASGTGMEPFSSIVGELRIVICQANMHMSNGQSIFSGLRKSFGVRPYVQLSTQSNNTKIAREWKTSTYRGLMSPKWNEEFRICLRGNETSIHLELMHDSSPRPLLLGSARIPLSLLCHASCQSWVPVYKGMYQIGEVLLVTSYSVPLELVSVQLDEAEARALFSESGGIIETNQLISKLEQLGYSQYKVDEILFIADWRRAGKVSYIQYWNAILPYIFENAMRYRASTIHPIFRSEEELPEIEPLTPPDSPRTRSSESGEDPSARHLSGFGRLPSTSSVVSAISRASSYIMNVISRPSSAGRSRIMPGSQDEEGGEPQEHGGQTSVGEESPAPKKEPMTVDEELVELAEKMMQRSMLFFCLDSRIVIALLRFAEHLVLNPNEYLYVEDENVDCISVVRSGFLTMYRPEEEEGTIGEAALEKQALGEESTGNREEFARLTKGDIIGEAQCLQKRLCSVCFRSQTKVRLFQIPRRNIMQMLPRRCREFFDPPSILESPIASPLVRTGLSPRRPTRVKPTGNDANSPPAPAAIKRLQVHKAGGALYEEARCVAKNLPQMKSGDRMRIQIDRRLGQLRFWINENELNCTLTGFYGDVRPMVYLTGIGSSCTLADRKERVIRLVVVAADGLHSADFLTGLSDPYVKIHLTSVQIQGKGAADLPIIHSFTTSVVRNSLTPEWDESFILTPHNLEDRLDLECWDHDLVGDDEMLGSFSCYIADVIDFCDNREYWFKLRDKKHNAAGKLCLRFEVSEPDTRSMPVASGKAPLLYRKMTFQADARMRRPRLKDLPECVVPDPALIRSLFQRCFASQLTVPQIRYFFHLWEDFESEVLGETSQQQKERFLVVRQMVWKALLSVNARRPSGHIGLPDVKKDSEGKPDAKRTPRIWYAIDAGKVGHKKVETGANERRDMLNRMATFKAGGSQKFSISHGIDKSLEVARHRHAPVWGTSLFLAPGALSGLLRPIEQIGKGGQSQNKLKAQWLKDKSRPSSAHQLLRKKGGLQKTTRFAEGSLLERSATFHIREAPKLASLGDGAQMSSDSYQIMALDAGFSPIQAEQNPNERATSDRTRTGSAFRPGSGRSRPGSAVRPCSGKSRSESWRPKSGTRSTKRPDSGITKSQNSVRSVRFQKYLKSQHTKRNLMDPTSPTS